MLDQKLARVKQLMERREEIDAELSQLLGIEPPKRRGRKPKAQETDQTAAE